MIVMGIAFGALMGWIIQTLKVQPFIATLMGLFFARGMAYIISLTSVTIKDPVYMKLALTPIYIPFIPKAYIYPPTLVGPIMLLVAIYLSFFTRFGRTIYAMGNNEQSALLMGLSVPRTKIMVYAFSGFCSALAGIVFSMSLLAGYGQFATGMELDFDCRCSDRRNCIKWRRWQCHWHLVWRHDPRHDRVHSPVQWHIEFMVDQDWRWRADLDRDRNSKPVQYEEKECLAEELCEPRDWLTGK